MRWSNKEARRVQNFWLLFYKTDRCWLWYGNIGAQGYGRYCDMLAHRFSFMLVNPDRKLVAGELILHHCDIRSCVNPAHLYVGSPADNWRDVRERNHGNRGTMNGMCTIPTSVVLAIQSRPKASRAHARKLGLRWSTYNQIHKKRRRPNG